MKCISLWQPYASLLALGRKQFETRSWRTPYRGRIAIHASKSVDSIQNICTVLRGKPASDLAMLYREIFATLDSAEQNLWKLPRGAIIATAELVECVPTTGLKIDWKERCVGDFAPGRWAWKMVDVRPLAKPIEYRGAQGIFEVALP